MFDVSFSLGCFFKTLACFSASHFACLGFTVVLESINLSSNRGSFHPLFFKLFFAAIFSYLYTSHPAASRFQGFNYTYSVQFRHSVFATSWTAARQVSLSITNSQSLLKLTSIELVMPCNRLILGHPLLLPPSIFPSIRVFSNKSVLHIR